MRSFPSPFQEKVRLSWEHQALQSRKGRDLCLYCRRPTTVTLSPPPTPPDLDKVCVILFLYCKGFVVS